MKERQFPDRPMTKAVPTFLFNEHNEAFYYWHKARKEGYLKKPLDIFHIDAHSDMATVQKLRSSLYWNPEDGDEYLTRYREIAHRDMNIANFIVPAVLNGIIRAIYFIYPEWRKYKRRRRKLNVASAFGEGKVLKHGIKIVDSEKQKMQIAYPDLVEYSYITTDIEHIPSKRKVILDIDLDYFACTDAITNRMSYALAITADQYRNRKRFAAENESLQYSGLEVGFEKKGSGYFAIVRFKKDDDKEHLPTESQIKREVDRITEVLAEKMIQPAVITICRSCISGYCPPEYFQMIEDYLLLRLQSSFPAIEIAN